MNNAEQNIFEKDLQKSEANYVSQSPLSWIKRAADIFPEITAVIHGDTKVLVGEKRFRDAAN